jgi:hypothetical protein
MYSIVNTLGEEGVRGKLWTKPVISAASRGIFKLEGFPQNQLPVNGWLIIKARYFFDSEPNALAGKTSYE